MKPSSFCCISSCDCPKTAVLYSLSKSVIIIPVYLLLDSFSNIYLKNYDFLLIIEQTILLDKYTKKSRDIMEKENIWNDFQMNLHQQLIII